MLSHMNHEYIRDKKNKYKLITTAASVLSFVLSSNLSLYHNKNPMRCVIFINEPIVYLQWSYEIGFTTMLSDLYKEMCFLVELSHLLDLQLVMKSY